MLNAARILRLDAAPKSVLHTAKHGVLNSGWLLRTNSRDVIFVKVLDLVDLFFRRVVVNRKSLSVRYAGIPDRRVQCLRENKRQCHNLAQEIINHSHPSHNHTPQSLLPLAHSSISITPTPSHTNAPQSQPPLVVLLRKRRGARPRQVATRTHQIGCQCMTARPSRSRQPAQDPGSCRRWHPPRPCPGTH
jgi:hypothetical protein